MPNHIIDQDRQAAGIVNASEMIDHRVVIGSEQIGRRRYLQGHDTEVGDLLPAEFYAAVAAILASIYRARRRTA